MLHGFNGRRKPSFKQTCIWHAHRQATQLIHQHTHHADSLLHKLQISPLHRSVRLIRSTHQELDLLHQRHHLRRLRGTRATQQGMGHPQYLMIDIQPTLLLPARNDTLQVVEVFADLVAEDFIQLRINARDDCRCFHRSGGGFLCDHFGHHALPFRHGMRLSNDCLNSADRHTRLAFEGIKQMSKMRLRLHQEIKHGGVQLNRTFQGTVEHMFKRPAKLTDERRADDAPTALDGVERSPQVG